MGEPPRVLFVQYANPASYPPIDHSTRLLAEHGFEVRVLGVAPPETPLRLPAAPNLIVDLMSPAAAGWRQKVHYAAFAARALATTVRWQPHWIYLSDPLSAPVGLALSALSRARLVYHEHDAPHAPATGTPGQMDRIIRARAALAARAALCVVPSAERKSLLAGATRRSNAVVVWNTPLRRDVGPPRSVPASELVIVYQGSIVPARLPCAVVDALAGLPATTRLLVIGYPTAGYPDYVDQLKRRAAERGVLARLEFAGELGRDALLRRLDEGHVGLAMFPTETTDINERTMVGASNKPFEYLARGLALLVGQQSSWHATYVQPGYARACDPSSVASVTQALRWFVDRPSDTAAMGEAGRQRVLDEWHYERGFAAVLAHLQHRTR